MGHLVIRFIYGDSLWNHVGLAGGMFRDRAAQFHGRMGWDVAVDAAGEERDEYDALNPLYVILQMPDGSHGGSMRFLPTVGPTMVNDHFLHLTDGVAVCSPLIWECSRFCLSGRGHEQGLSAALMLAGAEIGRRFYLNHAVGVFDATMIRLYRNLGWVPDIISEKGANIAVGLWDYGSVPTARLQKKSGLTTDRIQGWMNADLGAGKKRENSA